MTGELNVTVRPHPAKFNDPVADTIRLMVREHGEPGLYVDPFAGVGGVHDVLRDLPGVEVLGVEIEPEWAEQGATKGPMHCGDFFAWDTGRRVAGVVTSPTYGNRMADHHNATDASKRITYRHALGRELTDNNSGAMQWGVEYRAFHIKAWMRVWELLAGGGLFVINVKDHVRKGEVVPVSEWHYARLCAMGFNPVDQTKVPVRGMGFGANGQVRVDHEMVYGFVRTRDSQTRRFKNG